uniref:Uncharacterized protein n=1 Tax=Dicentrarchus labrax TaxID=13489 RepID=A0A8C4ER00_DICLA
MFVFTFKNASLVFKIFQNHYIFKGLNNKKHTTNDNDFIYLYIYLSFSIGAPRTAVYNFVRCNPEGDKANCVTQQSPEMAWSPDLPAKLPASTAQYLILQINAYFKNRNADAALDPLPWLAQLLQCNLCLCVSLCAFMRCVCV